MNWGRFFELIVPFLIKLLEGFSRLPPQTQHDVGNALAQTFTDDAQWQNEQNPPQQ